MHVCVCLSVCLPVCVCVCMPIYVPPIILQPNYAPSLLQEFFAKRSVPAAERTIQQSLENIRLNAAWLARDSANVRTWLQSRGYWLLAYSKL